MNCRYSMSPVLGLSVMITGMYCLSLFWRWLQLSGGQIISRKVSEYPESGAGRRKGGFRRGGFRRGSFSRRPGAWYYLGTFFPEGNVFWIPGGFRSYGRLFQS